MVGLYVNVVIYYSLSYQLENYFLLYLICFCVFVIQNLFGTKQDSESLLILKKKKRKTSLTSVIEEAWDEKVD